MNLGMSKTNVLGMTGQGKKGMRWIKVFLLKGWGDDKCIYGCYPNGARNERKCSAVSGIMSLIERKGRNMEWNERLQRIIDYVEKSSAAEAGTIDQREISVMAGCSFDFFKRCFLI